MDIIEWLDQRGITVSDPELIREAFMHSSYANEHHGKHDNERLEFMGDAVLQLWSSNAIFPLNLSEGKMTRLRAQLVCEHALAVYGRELHLNDFLLLGTGEEKTGGRNKEAIIADGRLETIIKLAAVALKNNDFEELADKIISDPQAWKPLADVIFEMVDKNKRIDMPELMEYMREENKKSGAQ